MSEISMSNMLEDTNFSKIPASPEDMFSIFDALEGLQEGEDTPRGTMLFQSLGDTELDILDNIEGEGEGEGNYEEGNNKRKKRPRKCVEDEEIIGEGEGSNKISHIAVERNRRKQMNEHLSVLRSLMPCFYVKRGDQASIIGGVVEYINELQQILQSLQSKKQRKLYSEVLSPRVVSSPRTNIVSSPRLIPPSPQVLSPRKPPLSPRVLTLPISPKTPQYQQQPTSPYNNHHRPSIISPRLIPSPIIDLSPSSSSTSSMNDFGSNNELVANSKSSVAEVEVKFSGPNLVLKTISPRIPGQVVKIVSVLEELSLEILNINISTIEDTMFTSFTIKIGIECQLSAEELAHQTQHTFSPFPLLN